MTALCVVFGLITVIFLAVLLFDAVPCVLTWTGRIGIGSLPKNAAKENVKKVTLKWLLKLPSVPLSDETRFTVIERVKGRYKNKNLASWQKAALLLGAEESGEKEKIKSFTESELTENGSFKNFVKSPDFALLAYAVLRNGDDKEFLRSAMDEVYLFLKESAKDGTVPYNINIKDIRFVDTLGMVCPFLTLYGKVYNCEDALILAKKQLREYADCGIDDKTGLPFHCFNVKSGARLGICGWGRGCGWYALSLSEMLRVSLDEEILCLAENFMKKLIPYQIENGGFSRQILCESTGESSGTAMIGHLASVLFKITGKEIYKKCADSAAEFIRLSTRKNGKVDYAQGDTKGIGFYSKKLDTMPAAQGFSLLLLEETA